MQGPSCRVVTNILTQGGLGLLAALPYPTAAIRGVQIGLFTGTQGMVLSAVDNLHLKVEVVEQGGGM